MTLLNGVFSDVHANFYLSVPAASGGIDLDSDLITQLAEECPNLCGVKLTYVL